MNGIMIYMGMHINHENMFFTQVLVKSGLNFLCLLLFCHRKK